MTTSPLGGAGAGVAASTRPGAGQPGRQVIARRTLLRSGLAGVAAWTLGSTITPTVVSATPSTRIGVDQFDVRVPAAWFDLGLRLVQTTPGFSPPVASRAFGYLGVTLYEAVLPGMPDHRSLAGRLPSLNALPQAGRNAAYDWPTVANSALAAIVRALFASAGEADRATIDRLESKLGAQSGGHLPAGLRRRSEQRGREVAAAIFDWSTSDGGHEGYLRNFDPAYIPPQGPGRWEPTPPGFLPALQPRWGGNRTFVVSSASACPAEPHTPYSEDPGSLFHAEAIEGYDTVTGLTAEQLAIARFWADDPGVTATPPGHSVGILTQLLRETNAGLATGAQAYARLGMAVADAFVCCWHVKYATNLLRPVTYIRRRIDAGWLSPVTTPPFPEYPSGHSVQSAAAAEVLRTIFGVRAFTDRTHEERGLGARTFASFDDAATEAAISRLYGGIHFRPAIEFGLDQGRCIGQAVNRLDLAA